MKELISFVIPCYNSGQTLTRVAGDIEKTMEQHPEYDYEMVLVNDNPPDETWRIIEELSRKNPKIRGICMAHNFGQHSALMAGFRKAAGDIIICLDDDGQTPPSEAFKLIGSMQGNVDVVYGDYPEDKFANVFRQAGSRANDLMAEWLLNKPKGLYLSSYIAARRHVIDQVVRYSGPYPYVDGLMLRSASGIVNTPVVHKQREAGSSGYSFGKLLGLWANGFTAFSVKPLRVGAVLGAILAAIGFVFALVVVIQKLIYQDAVDAGWSSIICLIMIIGGVLLLMLGLIGEYVGRIYLSINATPQYIVLKETKGMNSREDSPEKRNSQQD